MLYKISENIYRKYTDVENTFRTNYRDIQCSLLCDEVSQVFHVTRNTEDATISQVYYLTFTYSSTCFGHPHAHHQEPNNCSSSLCFYRWSVVAAVLLVVVGPTGPTTTTTLLPPRSNGKTRGCYCSC